MRLLRAIFVDRAGAASAEYALILAIVGAAIIVASLALSGAISNEMNDTSNEISR